MPSTVEPISHHIELSSPHGSASAVAAAAHARLLHYRDDYRRDAAPRSPNPHLSANRHPGKSTLEWLRNLNKCNQFVGDALFDAGMSMPTYRMPDGSHHYVNAGRLASFTRHFATVDLANSEPGDIIVWDYGRGGGENDAHTEIVSAIQRETGEITTIGARNFGAAATVRSLASLRRPSVTILRPRLALPTLPPRTTVVENRYAHR